MPYEPYEDEGVLRTDEQAGTQATERARVEKQDDVAHPPVAQTTAPQDVRTSLDDAAKKRFKAKAVQQTNEQAGTAAQEAPRAYPDEA